jgi:hypothetical protein
MAWEIVAKAVWAVASYVLDAKKTKQTAIATSRRITAITDDVIAEMHASLKSQSADDRVIDARNLLQTAEDLLGMAHPNLDLVIDKCLLAKNELNDPDTQIVGQPFYITSIQLLITALEFKVQNADARVAAGDAEIYLRSLRDETAAGVESRFFFYEDPFGVLFTYLFDGEFMLPLSRDREGTISAMEAHQNQVVRDVQRPFYRAGAVFSAYRNQYKYHFRYCLRASNRRYLILNPDNTIAATGTSAGNPLCLFRAYRKETVGALLCDNGVFLSVLSADSVQARFESLRAASTFEFVSPGPGKLALKSRSSHRYLNIHDLDGGAVVECRDTTVGADSTFTVVSPSDADDLLPLDVSRFDSTAELENVSSQPPEVAARQSKGKGRPESKRSRKGR